MSPSLSSKNIRFDLRPDGRWDLTSRAKDGPAIRSASLGLTWQVKGRRRFWQGDIGDVYVTSSAPLDGPHGSLQSLTLVNRIPTPQLKIETQFALSLSNHLFLWQVRVTNEASIPVALRQVDLLKLDLASTNEPPFNGTQKTPRASQDAQHLGSLRLHPNQGNLRFFTTGWQSWNFAGVLGAEDRLPKTRLGPFTKPILVNAGVPTVNQRGHFTSEMYAILGGDRSRTGILLGFLSQRQAFGSIETRLKEPNPFLSLWVNADGVHLQPGDTFLTDWACIQSLNLDETLPFETYLEAVARENKARQRWRTPVGWCSWYTYFHSVTQDDVIDNLHWMKQNHLRFPLEFVQIDDGFQTEIGDWSTAHPMRFNSGMKTIGEKIRTEGFKAGIWLAPFLANPGSKLLRAHPEWILRRGRILPVNAGFAVRGFPRTLDVTHPEYLEYLRDLMEIITQDWGYEYLKLDFLYAGALPGKRFDPSQTRAQGLYRALRLIRETVGDETLIVGCGCPLGSGIGIFDAMRVSPDVAPHWKPKLFGVRRFLEGEKSFPSVKNALHGTVSRLSLHQRWWINDPDCLLLRDLDTELTLEEVQFMASVVALSGGSLIVSDHLPTLSDKRADILAKLIPPLPSAAFAMDWFDSTFPSQLCLPLHNEVGQWSLLALLNWADVPQTISLDLDRCGFGRQDQHHQFDVWQASYAKVSGNQLTFHDIPPHSAKLFAIRPIKKIPQWVGDTIHVSQGLMIKNWKLGSKALQLKLHIDREVRGRVWMAFPSEPERILLDGKELSWDPIAEDIWAFDLEFENQANLDVIWG
jgi:alpha-galactosidase